MFTWLGVQFDTVLDGYVFGVVTKLAAALAPVALTSFTLWFLLFGWSILRNEVNDTLPSFLWKAVKISLILAFALNAGLFMSDIADTANALSVGVASTFLPDSIDPTTITSPYVLLDRFNDDASKQVADIMMEATIFRLDLLLAAILFSFGSVIYLCVALFVVTLAKLLLSFVLAIGPLFVLCLAWRPTQRFFDSWLSMVLNAVVLTWLAFFSLGLSTYIGTQIFVAIQAAGGFLGPSLNVLAESTKYFILMTLMGVLCFQAPSLAAALTGGAVMQQGIQMIQNAMMVAGLRSAARDRRFDGGGAIRQGVGAPYQAGHAAGATVAAGARAATGVAKAASRVPSYALTRWRNWK